MNFLGASREITVMKSASEKQNINFVYSLPPVTHLHGLSERGIRSDETYLSKLMGDQIVTYEDFYTMLTLTDSVLNSQP